MNKKNGYALTEILISIIVVGIIVVCLANLYASKARIDQKTVLNMQFGDTVKSVFEIFTADPADFTSNYNISINNNEETSIYFDGSFHNKLNEETDNKLLITYTIVDGYYQLSLKAYVKGTERLFNGETTLTRKIYVGS